MTKQKVLNVFRDYQSLSDQDRQHFFSAFERKMLYRTTKTENFETTPEMVQEVLKKYRTTT